MDLPTIAGLIAVVGTGIDQLVVITDEILHEGKVPSPNLYLKRLSRALGIIMVAAGTVIIAMLPLALMDLSTLKGFAIITMMGPVTSQTDLSETERDEMVACTQYGRTYRASRRTSRES